MGNVQFSLYHLIHLFPLTTYMIPVLSGTVVDKVIAELESCGFQCLVAGIGGNGVEICVGLDD